MILLFLLQRAHFAHFSCSNIDYKQHHFFRILPKRMVKMSWSISPSPSPHRSASFSSIAIVQAHLAPSQWQFVYLLPLYGISYFNWLEKCARISRNTILKLHLSMASWLFRHTSTISIYSLQALQDERKTVRSAVHHGGRSVGAEEQLKWRIDWIRWKGFAQIDMDYFYVIIIISRANEEKEILRSVLDFKA